MFLCTPEEPAPVLARMVADSTGYIIICIIFSPGALKFHLSCFLFVITGTRCYSVEFTLQYRWKFKEGRIPVLDF